MERSPSEFLGDAELDDQLESLVGMLQFSEAPQGLDDLLPVGNLDGVLKAELSDSDGSKIGCGSLDFQGNAQEQGADGKRRRRIRNAKQQELNRLAQQRYRQRKKQKYSDLQSAVDELSNRMAIITRLEGEAGELRRREAAVQGLLTTREVALQQAQAQLQQQQKVMEQQQIKIGEQQQQLDAIRMQQQQAEAAPSSPQLSEPQQQLCDRLLAALKEALDEVCEEHGLRASSSAQDQVLLRFRRSLSGCCKEIILGGGSSSGGIAPPPACAAPPAGSMPQAAAPAAGAAAMVAVPAAAAGQVKEAAHRVSVVCF